MLTYSIAVFFNLCNGYLMGSWLGGRTSPWTSKTGAIPEIALQSKLFWFGLLLWGLGFLGNLYSDEVLYNLRRPGPDGKPKPRYSIPHGFLYSWPFGGVSFPAYFCEWIEWTGFAIAAVAHSPAPALPSLLPSNPAALAAETAGKIVGQAGMLSDVSNRLLNSSAYITPPFLFLYAEIASELRLLLTLRTGSQLTTSHCISHVTSSIQGPFMVQGEVRQGFPKRQEDCHSRRAIDTAVKAMETSVALLNDTLAVFAFATMSYRWYTVCFGRVRFSTCSRSQVSRRSGSSSNMAYRLSCYSARTLSELWSNRTRFKTYFQHGMQFLHVDLSSHSPQIHPFFDIIDIILICTCITFIPKHFLCSFMFFASHFLLQFSPIIHKTTLAEHLFEILLGLSRSSTRPIIVQTGYGGLRHVQARNGGICGDSRINIVEGCTKLRRVFAE